MQTTLKSSVSFVGTGLHSGRPVRMVLRPASAEHGIWFRRVDVSDQDNMIPALYDAVADTRLCTLLRNNAGVSVSTVEHLMAALAGCGVHNVIVDIDGPEVPIMDGSAVRFVRDIMAAGIMALDAPVRVLRVLKTVSYEENGVAVSLSPADRLEIDFSIDFPDAAIGRQFKTLDMANGTFVRELSDCRTFCRRSDVEAMQASGLALGGSLDNAVVVDGDTVINPGGFRRADECVRHKMLDALGDLALSGAPIIGRYVGRKAGHDATNKLLRKLFATPGAVEMVDCTPEAEKHLPGFGIRQSDLAKVG